MLHDDKLKVQLKRVIRNTVLTGTYESVAINQKTTASIASSLMKNNNNTAALA